MSEADADTHIHDEVPVTGSPIRRRREEYGELIFTASKGAVAVFTHPFLTVPSVAITLDTNGDAAPPYKTSVTINGFAVKFQSNYTGTVIWQAFR
jgi:hypothetical protein